MPPKAKTDKARKDQAKAMVLAKAKQRRPELSDTDVEVFSTSPSRGDGDWRAVVIVGEGPEREVHLVGYNNETDQLFTEVLGKAV